MNRRAISTLSALALVAVLPVLAAPAQASAPTAGAEPPAERPAGRSDARPDPLATERSTQRQSAVDALLTGDARLRGKGADRSIQLADGTEVSYPIDETAQLLTFLVDFGDGTGNPAFPSQTAGPVNNTIPEPAAGDNSTYWKNPATGGFGRQHYLDMFFNGMEEQGGESFKGLYQEMSSGRFDLEGDVSDWVTVPHPESFYNDAEGLENQPEMTAFIGDSATAWYDAQVTAGLSDTEIKDYLAEFDVWDRYDYDGDGVTDEPDGYIDHFQAVHAGEGEEAGAPPWAIWSHRWAANQAGFGVDGPDCSGCYPLGGVEIGDTGYWIRDYTTEPENGGLGVFAHEFGHDLGLPDFYDTNPEGTTDNGSAFWTLMSSGSWMSQEGAATGTTPNHMGPTEKAFLGWYGANDMATVDGLSEEPVEVTLGPSTRATTKGRQVAVVTLPDGVDSAAGPAVGSTDDDYLYSGARPLTVATATAPTSLQVPVGDSTLTARVAYDIETDYDYAYLEVLPDGASDWEAVETSLSSDTNPEGQNLGFGITGDSGDHGESWQSLTADLEAFEGSEVGLRWTYVTDPSTTYLGLVVDDLEIGGYATAYQTGSDWVLDGFHLVEDGGYDTPYTRYYLAENRQYRDYDTTLEHGPYSANGPGANQVDHFPYQDGLLLWYLDGRYSDNNTSTHPGGGLALPVDASPTNLMWQPEAGDAVLARERLQSFDSTFDVDETDALSMTRGDETLTVPAGPSVPVFEDADPDAYLDDSGGAAGLAYSTGVSGLGAEIQVLSSNETTGVIRLKIGKRFVAAVGQPKIDGAHTLGDTLTAVLPTWFQSGVTTSAPTWLRDGEPIAGAAGATYEITAADTGHAISVEFTGTKADYTATTVESLGVAAVADPPPTPTSPLEITGDAQVGETLTAGPASWPVAGATSYSWSIGDDEVGTGTTYVVKPGDLGSVVNLTETLQAPGYETANTTADSDEIALGDAPTPTDAPTISGDVQVGRTLTALGATWTLDGESTYSWSVGPDEVGTGTTYVVKPGDLGEVITLSEARVTPAYEDAAVGVDSVPVVPGTAPTALTAPRISGLSRVGSTLTVTKGTWPLAGASSFAWTVGGAAVGTGTTYVLKPADAGKQVTVTETFTSPGYNPGTASVRSATVAKAPVALTVKTGKAKKNKKVTATIRATSPGLTVPGKAQVTYAGKSLGNATLKSGKATVRLPGRKRGNYRLKVTYPGATGFGTASRTIIVKVR